MAAIAQESSVCSAGLSVVGFRGAVFTSVPKNNVSESGSYDGVDQTLLVAGPYSNLFVPQEPSTTIGGSNFSGFRPTSYFQTSLPVFGSSATRKPRPVLPGYEAVPANICSSVPPANTTLPPAMIGEAIKRLFQWASR